MIVCTACNAENLDGKTFCHHCGAALAPPPMVDCVVCAAPVKLGAKFCKRCGSAQPEPKAAVAESAPVRPAATRQAHADEDDNEKTVILTPQAREAMMAQAKSAAQRTQSPPSPPSQPAASPDPVSSLFAPPSETRAEAAPPAPPARQEEVRRETSPPPSLHDQAAVQAHAPKRNYLAIGLGVGAFLVAALVSTLLLMSGHSSDPVPVTGDAATSIPLADASTPVEVASAPVAVPEPVPTQAVQAEVSAPVEAVPAPPPADAAAKKPKAKPKADSSAAKRKQAEEALQRLLNQ